MAADGDHPAAGLPGQPGLYDGVAVVDPVHDIYGKRGGQDQNDLVSGCLRRGDRLGQELGLGLVDAQGFKSVGEKDHGIRLRSRRDGVGIGVLRLGGRDPGQAHLGVLLATQVGVPIRDGAVHGDSDLIGLARFQGDVFPHSIAGGFAGRLAGSAARTGTGDIQARLGGHETGGAVAAAHGVAAGRGDHDLLAIQLDGPGYGARADGLHLEGVGAVFGGFQVGRPGIVHALVAVLEGRAVRRVLIIGGVRDEIDGRVLSVVLRAIAVGAGARHAAVRRRRVGEEDLRRDRLAHDVVHRIGRDVRAGHESRQGVIGTDRQLIQHTEGALVHVAGHGVHGTEPKQGDGAAVLVQREDIPLVFQQDDAGLGGLQRGLHVCCLDLGALRVRGIRQLDHGVDLVARIILIMIEPRAERFRVDLQITPAARSRRADRCPPPRRRHG